MTIWGDLQAMVESNDGDWDEIVYGVLRWLASPDVVVRLQQHHDPEVVDKYRECVATLQYICGKRESDGDTQTNNQ